MLYETLPTSDKDALDSYVEFYTEFMETYGLMLNENGQLSVDLMGKMNAEETSRLRSMTTLLRQLSHDKDLAGFAQTRNILECALDETKLSSSEIAKKHELFNILAKIEENCWDTLPAKRRNPKKPHKYLTAEFIIQIIHYEYILHNQPDDKTYYRKDYPMLATCPIAKDYLLLVQERNKVFSMLATMVWTFRKSQEQFFELDFSIA